MAYLTSQPEALQAILQQATDGMALWDAARGHLLNRNPAWDKVLAECGATEREIAQQLQEASATNQFTWLNLASRGAGVVRVGVVAAAPDAQQWLLLLPPDQRNQEDVVTGVADRRQLQRELEARFASQRAFAVVFVDLDGFKQVNDLMGHMAGDIALRRIAQRLRRNTRPQDMVARFGGDEFVLLVDDAKREEDLSPVVGRVQEAVAQPQDELPPSCALSASIGIAFSVDTYTCPADMLAAADKQMYARKRRRSSGKDHSAA